MILWSVTMTLNTLLCATIIRYQFWQRRPVLSGVFLTETAIGYLEILLHLLHIQLTPNDWEVIDTLYMILDGTAILAWLYAPNREEFLVPFIGTIMLTIQRFYEHYLVQHGERVLANLMLPYRDWFNAFLLVLFLGEIYAQVRRQPLLRMFHEHRCKNEHKGPSQTSDSIRSRQWHDSRTDYRVGNQD